MSDAYDRETALSRLDDDLELLTELAEVYLGEEPELARTLGEAIESCDAEAISRAAHKLKGAASNFCADPTVGLAEELEKIARAGELENAQEIYERLKAEYLKLNEALRELASTA